MASFSAAQDFQTTRNSAGVWTYGYCESGGSGYALVPFDNSEQGSGSTTSAIVWSKTGYNISGTPSAWRNLGSQALYGVGPGQLSIHPGPRPNGDFAIVRFTAPTTSTYTIRGQFFAGDTGQMDGRVVLKGDFDHPLQYFPVTTDGSLLDLPPMNLAAGDSVDFMVGNNGDFSCGNTPLEISIHDSPAGPERIAVVLSGGGSRGDFQLGALTALYEAGIRPDIVCSTSVGSLNALMLTQGEEGLDQLRKIWFGLRRNDHMWQFEDWWQDVNPELRKAVIGAMLGDNSPSGGEQWSVATGALAGGGIGAAFGPPGILIGALAGAAVTGMIQNITADAMRDFLLVLSSKARALLNLNPIRSLMSEHFDPAKLAQFIESGRKLRMATVGLESGELCYVTETGDLVRRNGLQRIASGVSILEGAMASSSIAAVFPPVNLAGDAWVDGGHRENVPLRAAIQAGATRIYVVCSGPIDRWSSVNRTADSLFDKPPPTDYESRKILDIANRALLEIHLDEMESDDVYPVIDNSMLPITVIAPEFPSHDIVTIDSELVRVNYDYGYRTALDAIGNAPAVAKEHSTRIALNQGRASRLRKLMWRGIGVPPSAEIATLTRDANAAMEARSALGARNTGTGSGHAFSQGYDMLPSELMLPDQSITSPDGRFMLIFQTDGHLVIYRASEGNAFAEAIWATGVYGFTPGVCVMQRDGNLVVYDADLAPRWSSGTFGNPDIALRLQIDGNLVLHRDDKIIWQSQPPVPDHTPVVRVVNVVNTSPNAVTVRFYNVEDGPMWATLPDGEKTIPSGSSIAWSLPPDFLEVKLTFDGRQPKNAIAGETVTYSSGDRVRILNQSPRAISVRIYKETDVLLRLATLPGGDLTLAAGDEAVWEMPQDVDKAAVVLNSRQTELAIRGSVIIYAQDDRILVRNLSADAIPARFYKVDDTLRWVTLPGGDITVSGNGESFFTVPNDLVTLQVVLSSQRLIADIGAVLNFNADGSVTQG